MRVLHFIKDFNKEIFTWKMAVVLCGAVLYWDYL